MYRDAKFHAFNMQQQYKKRFGTSPADLFAATAPQNTVDRTDYACLAEHPDALQRGLETVQAITQHPEDLLHVAI
jgi:hypothetical protein